ncbi:MAG: DUF2029 domain-containing protein [Clostridiales bacterium]|nr:DUF2029 domain-containing protein [Clostridiales bacterium]
MIDFKALKKDYRFWICAFCGIVFVGFLIADFFRFAPPSLDTNSVIFMCLITLLPFIIIVAVMLVKDGFSKATLAVLGMLALSYLLRILFADYRSNDYNWFLSKWVAEYRTLSVSECFVKQVGNYPPVYNYFLIAFSRIKISDLYLIKTLSFYFEILAAVFAVKTISLLRQSKFDFFALGIFLLLPIFWANSSQWAQCDALYTSCVVVAVYFALKHNSIVAYVMIGLALAIKLQTALILPVGMILLLCKSPDGKKYLLWRWIWIVPVVFFAASALPAMYGGSFFKVIHVYLNQSTVGNAGQSLNGHCANILLMLYHVPKGSVAYYMLLVLFIAVTAAVDVFIIVHTCKSTNRTITDEHVVFLCLLLPMISVFFMPKMLDRFYYIAEVYAAVYLLYKRDTNMFTSFVAFETGQWLIYTRTLAKIKYAFGLAPIFVVFALWLVVRRFFTYFPHDRLNYKFFTERPVESPAEQSEQVEQQ